MLSEPLSSKSNKLVYAHIDDSDQTAHPRSLIRVFDGHYMGSQRHNVSSCGKPRLRSDCADAQTGFEYSLYVHANVYLMPDTGS